MYEGDYFRFQVGDNLKASSLSIVTDGPLRMWIGDPSFGDPTYGFVSRPVDGDVFSQMGISSLSAGSYGMYIESENAGTGSPNTSNYHLDFSITAVPEPSIFAFSIIGCIALMAFRYRFFRPT
jgi:hypothetical protein